MTAKLKGFIPLFLLCSLLLTGCSSFLSSEGDASSNYIFNENLDPVLAENAQNLLTSKCLSCHFAGSASGYLNFPELINDGFIVQGPSEQTVMYRCINNTCVTRDGRPTTNMAVNGNLTSEEIALLNEFLDALFIYVP